MLHIQDIRKQYKTGELVQTALDGVSLTLRDSEFVAILGPSGSGKTTLLNVIGGLDRYDSGDLVINGISTKHYTDRDWDAYRNHTIGFVFQSYNLIPHQTILANVELALTISGVSRAERRRRAVRALEDVGLGDQIHKRPNQMSGGQMQRVAIARALVNNPKVLLADEPTGALDSETSLQVMELLKEVSKDRLVVMVTHNPELAEAYANRIVRVKDGRVIDDTNPCIPVLDDVPPEHKRMGRASMSYFTALALSFNNLRTKKGRTILTAFAGSIGIIGIALILSLSTGSQRYIDQIQEDTLSNYPLVIQSETTDMAAALMAFGASAAEAAENEPGVVSEQQMISQMFAQVGSNDLGAFKTHLESHMDEIGDTINTIKYGYSVKPLIFLEDTSEKIVQVNPATLFGELTGSASMSAYMDSDVFQEMIDAPEMLESQYDVLQGRWPEKYDEMVLVLSNPYSISDYLAYTLGMRDADELQDMMDQVMNGEEPEVDTVPMDWTYDELMALSFRLVSATDLYKYNEKYDVWEDMSDSKPYMRARIKEGVPLHIVGIVCPKDGVSATTLSTGIAYTSALTDYVIQAAADTEIVKDQLQFDDIDVFTGKAFDAKEEEESGLDFEDMISVDEEALKNAFGGGVSEDDVAQIMESYMKQISSAFMMDPAQAKTAFLDTLSALSADMLNTHIAENADPETGKATLSLSAAETMVQDYLATGSAKRILSNLTAKYVLPQEIFAGTYGPLMTKMLTEYITENAQSAVPPLPSPAPSFEPAETPIPEATEVPEATAAPESTPLPEVSELPEENEIEGSLTESVPVLLTDTAEEGESLTLLTETQNIGSMPQWPGGELPEMTATISAEDVEPMVSALSQDLLVQGMAANLSEQMTKAAIQKTVMTKVMEYTGALMESIAGAFEVDEDAIAAAFHFEMDEEELTRLMEAMTTSGREKSQDANLKALGYADYAKPTSISVYLLDFAAKERFMDFIDAYNADMEDSGREELVIRYTDITGMMMSSVRTIVDSVSYVLIAFVAVSMVVSSIMIGIITYISVMERTKEIGILRAIGASKRNIAQVFNAETFIIGLCSGLLGVGVSLLLLIPINKIIYLLTDMTGITAQLPPVSAVILILLSIGLTLLGGLIPSKQAARKDPVIALRSE